MCSEHALRHLKPNEIEVAKTKPRRAQVLLGEQHSAAMKRSPWWSKPPAKLHQNDSRQVKS
jgi:hypothetical protein